MREQKGDVGVDQQAAQQMEKRIEAFYGANDMSAMADAQWEMSADDILLEYPQSGERFRGRDRIREMNEGYQGSTGTQPTATLRRVVKPGRAWIIEGVIDYGDGVPVNAISIVETDDDGKVTHQTDYFAYPFEAPAWRERYREAAPLPSA